MALEVPPAETHPRGANRVDVLGRFVVIVPLAVAPEIASVTIQSTDCVVPRGLNNATSYSAERSVVGTGNEAPRSILVATRRHRCA